MLCSHFLLQMKLRYLRGLNAIGKNDIFLLLLENYNCYIFIVLMSYRLTVPIKAHKNDKEVKK